MFALKNEFLVKSYSKFNFFNLLYTLVVIAWGAWVRASGSGAGCGAHWPLCNGQVLPPTESLKTLVEFTHRLTSGLSLFLVCLGWLWSRRGTGFEKEIDLKIRKCANFSVIAILLEALLGAALVLLKLVALDQSAMRAISIALHLVNTLFLLATLTTLTWLSFQGANNERKLKLVPENLMFRATFFIFILLGIAGAITALGDTLFPSVTLAEGMRQDGSIGAHFLLKLRVIHPLLAVLWVMMAFFWSKELEVIELLKLRAWFLILVISQFMLGFLNWILMAPGWMQIVHLLVADLVFITLVMTGLEYEARKSRLQT